MVNDIPSLRQFLLSERKRDPALADMPALLEDLAQASRRIAHLLTGGALAGILGSAGAENVQGEVQRKLDIIANDILLQSLEWSGHWAGIASEELEDAFPIPDDYRKGRYLCMFDPLDGSSNIDVNGSVGTIFSILRCPEGVTVTHKDHFLQPGTAQLAAGFVLYGPATVLVLTVGNGVHGFTLEKGSGEYLLSHPDIRCPPDTREFTINMSNQRYWSEPMRRYIDECLQGTESPRGIHFNMRWAGSMVADVYRVLINGGVFMYPYDRKDPQKPGKLRLLYEVNPMSFIVEQAGGGSSTGTQRTMELQPTELHQRSPVILGSKNEVDRVVAYHLNG